MSLRKTKIAIVCDWLTSAGGAEKIILSLHNLFPDAPIYTSIYNPDKVRGFENAKIITSYLQDIPFSKSKYQYFLAFMPGVFESFNLDEYDIVISSSHSCAKGIITNPSTLHICYCHNPMRYAWEDSFNYIQNYYASGFVKRFARRYIHKLRMWDFLSSSRVDNFIANSKTVQQRVQKFYRRSSIVINPFINTKEYKVSNERSNYYLAVGRLTPYKKFDLIIQTFNKTGLPIKIAGEGVYSKYLRSIAKSNIEFLGFTHDQDLKKLYQNAKALIFPQKEDFGITPLEAMASGCPVIAYAKGGATETIIDKKTGIFFDEQTESSLLNAINQFEKHKFDHLKIAEHAKNYDLEVFNKKILDYINEKWEDHTRAA